MLGLYDKNDILIRTFTTAYDVVRKMKLSSREVIKKLKEIDKRGYSVIIDNKKIYYLRELTDTNDESAKCRKRRRVATCADCLHHNNCPKEGE